MAQKLVLVSVRDNAARTFGQPFFVPHVQVAVRSFTDEVNRAAEDNQVFRHSGDYDLYALAEFDDQTGVIVGHPDGPSLVVRGKDVKVASNGSGEDLR